MWAQRGVMSPKMPKEKRRRAFFLYHKHVKRWDGEESCVVLLLSSEVGGGAEHLQGSKQEINAADQLANRGK